MTTSTYSEQLAELEKIIGEIENGELSIDHLAAKVKEAASLLQDCRKRLTTVSEEVDKILNSTENQSVK